MDTNHFIELRKIFDQAAALPVAERENFIERSCVGNQTLLAEARALLLAHENACTTASLDPPETPRPARMIGPYRILHELGAGGMGLVYLAVRDDGAFRKNVAIKLLKPDHATSDFIQRFHQERQVLANLDHPNIARILDGGQTADGVPYHVMEYVEGLTLDRFCDTQKLGLADRIRLFLQVVSAVGYLHENLVIHRDLKPSNILVTAEGQVKLLDFGIAKLQAAVPQSPDVTRPADRLLTPNYASPEQIGGAPMTRASDLYSLGVILYELLTGKLPYENSTSKLTEDPPLPSANIRDDLQRTPETTAQLRRRIVGDLDQIVLLCLRRNPRHRYVSASALAEDLQRFLDGKSVLARREPVVERAMRFLKRNRTAVAACMLVLALLGVGTWQMLAAQIRSHMADVREAAIKQILQTLEGNHPAPSPTCLDDVRKLRRALEKDLAPAWSLKPGLTPERKALLQRASRYLDGLQPYTVKNSVLAAEVAGAYMELGVLYGSGYRDFALPVFTSAAQVLEQGSGGNPGKGPYAQQWSLIVASITQLGGTIPVYVPSTLEKKLPTTAAEKPGQKPLQTPENPQPDPPVAVVVQPEVDSAEYESVHHLLERCAARAALADETFANLRNDVEQNGQSLHSEIIANHNRMNSALDSARAAMENGDLAAARTDIGIANEHASRIMKLVGR